MTREKPRINTRKPRHFVTSVSIGVIYSLPEFLEESTWLLSILLLLDFSE